jgi:hypothetical protein
MKSVSHDLLRGFRSRPIAFAIGSLALPWVLSACAPQNSTKPTQLSAAGYQPEAVAADIQSDSGARHFVLYECDTRCQVVHIVKSGDQTRRTVVASNLLRVDMRYNDDSIDIAARAGGTAVVAWPELNAGAYLFRYAVVTQDGTVNGPFDLSAAGQTSTVIAGKSPTVKLAAGGVRVMAVYLVVDNRDQMRLFYRQLLAAPASASLLESTTSYGGPGYLASPKLRVDSLGHAHIAWRAVRVGAPGVGFTAIRYVRAVDAGSPTVAFQTLNPADTSVSEPDLALYDGSLGRKVWIAYHQRTRISGGPDEVVMNAVRVDDGVVAMTRTLPLGGPVVTSGVVAPSIAATSNTAVAVLAFRAARSGSAVAAGDAYFWQTGEVTATRLSYLTQIARPIVGVVNGAAPLIAFASANPDAPGVFVYDRINDRTVYMSTDEVSKFDFEVRGAVASGAWLAGEPGRGPERALEARNDTTPQSLIEVTTLSDEVVPDAHISLREAMRIANGSKKDGFSAAERAQLEAGGCIFDLGVIVGGCGRGVTDTVALTRTLEGPIRLTSALPVISDSAPTYLRGPRPAYSRGLRLIEEVPAADAVAVSIGAADAVSQPVSIDASNFPSLEAAIVISSDGNIVSNLGLFGAQRGVLIQADGNRIEDSRAYSVSVAGFEIDGGVENAIVASGALPLDANSACDAGAMPVGVRVHNGALRSNISRVATGCTTDRALVISGATTVSTTVSSLSAGGESGPGSFDGARGVLVNGARETKISTPNIVDVSGAAIEVDGGATDTTILGLRVDRVGSAITVGSAPRTSWLGVSARRYGPLPFDTGTLGAADPPPLVISNIDAIGLVISGTGAAPGARVDVYAVDPRTPQLVQIGITTAAADGTWRYAPADEVALIRGLFGSCMQVGQTTAAGSSELSELRCGYAQLLPLTSRSP